jgi:hypothetical protein
MASDSQITNTLGAQVVFDGEVPRTFTATAREVISGGFLVQISGATGDVGSQISSYTNNDLKVIGAQDVKLCNGIALNNAASGVLVTVARRGDYLMNAGAVVSGGALVGHNASGGVGNILNAGSVPVTTMGNTPIGRAVTTSASGTDNYALVSLNL